VIANKQLVKAIFFCENLNVYCLLSAGVFVE